jgi:hypothetical protein
MLRKQALVLSDTARFSENCFGVRFIENGDSASHASQQVFFAVESAQAAQQRRPADGGAC